MTRHDDDTWLRHRLDHAREAVDLDILWDVIQMDQPQLVSALRQGSAMADTDSAQ